MAFYEDFCLITNYNNQDSTPPVPVMKLLNKEKFAKRLTARRVNQIHEHFTMKNLHEKKQKKKKAKHQKLALMEEIEHSETDNIECDIQYAYFAADYKELIASSEIYYNFRFKKAKKNTKWYDNVKQQVDQVRSQLRERKSIQNANIIAVSSYPQENRRPLNLRDIKIPRKFDLQEEDQEYRATLENALIRASEFICAQKQPRALEFLFNILLHAKEKDNQGIWHEHFEDIMSKFLELCVELKESALARDGIELAIDDYYSFDDDDLIRQYIGMAESKVQLEAVSRIDGIEDSWINFLFESYHECLDLCHDYYHIRLYHDILGNAFMFCVKYGRKLDFRELCDHFHVHLNVQYRNVSTHLLLDSCLLQLDYSIQLELWHEAYLAADGISKCDFFYLNQEQPKIMASYYEKLAYIFWSTSSHLFHAFAQFGLFHLFFYFCLNISNDQLQKMASTLVVAVLSIPIASIRPEMDKLVLNTEENLIEEHNRELFRILDITTTKPPTRASLIVDLKQTGWLEFASKPAQELFELIEEDFNPLCICDRVQRVIVDYLESIEEVTQYIPSLKEVTIVQFVHQLSRVYKSIDFNRMAQLCPLADQLTLERIIVDSARRHDLPVRIDHRAGCYYFFGTEPNEGSLFNLANLYSSLQKAMQLLEPNIIQKQRDDLKRQTMRAYYETASFAHRRILNRQAIIEKRKELIELMQLERELNEQQQKEDDDSISLLSEQIRVQDEFMSKLVKGVEEMLKRRRANHVKKMRSDFPDLQLDDEQLAQLQPRDLYSMRMDQLEAKRRETLSKQLKLERQKDIFERAKRVEEHILLEQQFKEWRIEYSARIRAKKGKQFRRELIKDSIEFVRQLEESHKARAEELAVRELGSSYFMRLQWMLAHRGITRK